jgi:hypothetical protein
LRKAVLSISGNKPSSSDSADRGRSITRVMVGAEAVETSRDILADYRLRHFVNNVAIHISTYA